MKEKLVKLITSRISAIFFAVVLCFGLVLGSDYLMYLNISPSSIELKERDRTEFISLFHYNLKDSNFVETGILFNRKSNGDFGYKKWYSSKLNCTILIVDKLVVLTPERTIPNSQEIFFDLSSNQIYTKTNLPDSLYEKIFNQIDDIERHGKNNTHPLAKKVGYIEWKILLSHFRR